MASPAVVVLAATMPTVKQLQEDLKARGLDTKGKKAELEARLAEHDAQKDAAPAAEAPPAEKEPAPPPAAAEAPATEEAAPANASRKRKADEEPAQAAPQSKKVATTAPQPKKAAGARRGNAPVTEFRQDAYGKYETHTQYAPAI